ncbi:MAG: class I SAM-dependent methyltransferase [Planctomycetota bacterium]
MSTASFGTLLTTALAARAALHDARHETALRLFNGFTEGSPGLAIDLYARTLVLHNHADPPGAARALLAEAQAVVLRELPWVRTIIVKPHKAATPGDRRGTIVHATPVERPKLDRHVQEHGVRYSIDLLMHQDTTLYLDTRNLRLWAKQQLAGKSALNMFAYTGSLGVAAMAGGARRVVHVDRNRAFLNIAKTSYVLNGLPVRRSDFQHGDFFTHTSRLRRAGEKFDCVFVDPPFFSATEKGTVDLASGCAKLINKVRPLVEEGGHIVSINNALFVSGADYLATLEALCADGHLAIETFIDVPLDVSGYPHTRTGALPADPSPFNHPTKIAVLRVRPSGRPQPSASRAENPQLLADVGPAP